MPSFVFCVSPPKETPVYSKCAKKTFLQLSLLIVFGYRFHLAAVLPILRATASPQIVLATIDGTVTRHYYRYLEGEQTSTNPIATIFAWTGALAKRGELDGNEELISFAKKLEQASLDVIESGRMTKDLVGLWQGSEAVSLNTEDFIKAARERLELSLA